MLESIEAFGEDVSTPITPAVQNNMFDIDGDSELLEKIGAVFYIVLFRKYCLKVRDQ